MNKTLQRKFCLAILTTTSFCLFAGLYYSTDKHSFGRYRWVLDNVYILIGHNYNNKLVFNHSLTCVAWTPCVYEDEVDLRVIVLTHDRANSLAKLLKSLDALEMDGDVGSLEIWIDPMMDGTLDNDTLKVAKQFQWSKGQTRVHIQTSHVNIMGQWVDTWRPITAPSFRLPTNKSTPDSIWTDVDYTVAPTKEMALILEDDLTVSSQAYRFIKSAHWKYRGRKDFAGVTLQSDEVSAHNTGKHLAAPRNQSTFMYVCVGTWGFSPAPQLWAQFQDWFHEMILHSRQKNNPFHPYVEGTRPNAWYKDFESRGKQESMWEMWFIHFTHVKKAYTVFSNLNAVNNDVTSCVGINRREKGLHYSEKGAENLCGLLSRWNESFVEMMPSQPMLFDWNGNVIRNATISRK